jgi:23S rRNA (adenine2503-C2)-methyltransferase
LNKSKALIRHLSLAEIQEWLISQKEPKYRAQQIFEKIWKQGIHDFSQINNIPVALRDKLTESFEIGTVKEQLRQVSTDKTIKLVFELYDGKTVEGVLIPAGERMTACVSSQVGCSLDCKFCATGYLDRERNLESFEIYDQVKLIHNIALEKYGCKLTNIVYMGMGEPLLNYKNVVNSVHQLTDENRWGLSAKRITISTSGICKMIKKLADEKLNVNLALSLHAANDEKRSAIMPINDSNNLTDLLDAMTYWVNTTGIRPTLEYCVINNTNSETEEAEELIAFASQFPNKINLIEYNPIEFAEYERAGQAKIEQFAKILEGAKLIVNVRRSRGKDIDAACGQLAGKTK